MTYGNNIVLRRVGETAVGEGEDDVLQQKRRREMELPNEIVVNRVDKATEYSRYQIVNVSRN